MKVGEYIIFKIDISVFREKRKLYGYGRSAQLCGWSTLTNSILKLYALVPVYCSRIIIKCCLTPVIEIVPRRYGPIYFEKLQVSIFPQKTEGPYFVKVMILYNRW